MLQYHNLNKLEHYSYFDNIHNNIWFKYFEPVKFEMDDSFHLETENNDFTFNINNDNKFEFHTYKEYNFGITVGCYEHNTNAGDEFRIPVETRKLILDNVIVYDLNKYNVEQHDKYLYNIKYSEDEWFNKGMFEHKYSTVKPFDWDAYTTRYPNLNIAEKSEAIQHFTEIGFQEGLTGSSDTDYNFNFRKWRYAINNTFTKYIALKPAIKEKIDIIFSGKNNQIISVHCRHPSAICEAGLVLLKDYYAEINSILKVFPDSCIFLATDSDFIISSFQFEYGKEKIFYNEGIIRTDIDNVLEWAFSLTTKTMNMIGLVDGVGYQVHHIASSKDEDIDLGEDIVLDLFCLARGNFLIGAQSNITLALSYINPDIDFRFIKPKELPIATSRK